MFRSRSRVTLFLLSSTMVLAPSPISAAAKTQAASKPSASSTNTKSSKSAGASSSTSGTTSSKADAACSAASAAHLELRGVALSDVCSAVLDDFKNRPIEPNPPLHYLVSDENTAFANSLMSSLGKVNSHRTVMIDFAKPVTVNDLRIAKAPDYKESEIGVWLDRVQERNKVVEIKDTQAAVLVPLLFDWVGKPLIKFFIDKFFKKDPYKKAKHLDAVVRTYGSGANAGNVRRICFVPAGRANIANICPLS